MLVESVYIAIMTVVCFVLQLILLSYVGVNYLYCYYDCCLFCLIVYLVILELGTMKPLGWHPPHIVDNTDTLYLETSIDNSSVGFVDFSKQSFRFSLIQIYQKLALVCNSYGGENYLCCYCDYYLLYLMAYLIIFELETISL